MPATHRVVIVGGGFGGLRAAQALARVAVDVTLVDRQNHHLFQPLLYQVATGGLSPANIAAPLRSLLARQRNARVLLGEVVDCDLAGRRVKLSDGELPYDSLIFDAGSTHSYFAHPEWEPLAPGLKTIEDATAIRARVLRAFETAERLQATDHHEVASWLTFVIVGAGPTGLEMAGALAELAHETLRHEFRSIDPTRARIVLVEGADRVIPPFAPELSAKARAALERLRVEVRTGTQVIGVEPGWVTLKTADQVERLAARTVIWSAGVEASPLARRLAQAAGSEVDRGGRVSVWPDLTLPGYPEVFVIGDMAHCLNEQGLPLPGVAPVAMQQGTYAARLIAARLRGETLPPFRYHDHGTMATIGVMQAVVDLRGWRFAGPFAWLVWLFVHLMQLVQFHNRVLVLIQWAWHYFTRNRAARLITGEHDPPPPAPPVRESSPP
ncbi:MAG: NAD(P)/FAD-dependent oxidoreductase [Planctomycetaceae bacterium]